MKKKNKKVLYLVSTKSITINLFFKNFINYAKNKFEIKVICSDPKNLILDKKISKIQLDFPNNILDLINPRKLFNLFYQLSILKSELKNSIILLNTPIAAHFFIIYFFFSKLNLIYFVHGFRFLPSGKYYKNFIFKNIEKFLSIPTNKYITINSFDYNFVKKNFKKNCIKVNGVGIKKQEKNNFKFTKDKLKILIISAYKSEKGYNDVLYTANFFNNKNLNIKFTCFGYGKYRHYKNIVIKKKLKTITIKKFDKNLSTKIKNYNLLFHPSFREGLPVSVIQCLSNGLPVVARDIRGCNDLIKNNYNGYLFKNKSDLIKKILKLYNDKNKLLLLSKNAYKSIDYSYSSDYIAKKISFYLDE